MQSKAVIDNLTTLAITYAAKGDITVARGIIATIVGKLVVVEINNTAKKQRSI